MLSFENITWKVKNRTILNKISASFKPNQLTAIMGGSGAGKTSLFKILSGRTATKYSGKILVNGQPINQSDILNISGYVYQSDILPSDEYVLEYLQFVSELKIGTKNVSKLLDILGLTEIQNSIIGDANSGISGGQKKRLSIAAELIGNPEILFLDEPTSGLDVFSATKLIKYLKRIKKTCIISIHQPSTEIFNMFDDIIILKDTKIFYKGSTKDFVPYLKNQGFQIPEFTNPADYLFTHVLPVIRYEKGEWNKYNNTNLDDLESEVSETERGLERLLVHEEETQIEMTHKVKLKKVKKHNFYKEIKMLIRRYALNIKRNRILGIMRMVEITSFILTIAPLFYKISTIKPETLRVDIIRGFHYTLTNNCFWMASLNCADLFFYDSTLFIKEYRASLYHLISYYLSKNIVSVIFCSICPIISAPIFLKISGIKYSISQWGMFLVANILCSIVSHAIGIVLCCIFPTSQITIIALQIILLPLSALSGMVCVPSLLIFPLRMLQYLSPTRYAISILLNNHYKDDELPEFIKALNEGMPSVNSCCLILIIYLIVINLISYFSLSIKIKNKY